ncbi:MAG TPA: DNA methyltransferase [Anaerolineae bacterium]|nr:DNA methyltransferase [Anaerolineae bacterium]
MIDYQEFLATKATPQRYLGVSVSADAVHPLLFPFQRDVVCWAVRKGRAAVFLDTGMGKTLVQLEWARLLGQRTLIIAPLSVARQTTREGRKIGLDARYVRSQAEVNGDHKLWITNYEMIGHFDLSQFGAVVLDESSILKALDGKTRRRLIGACQHVPYRLACTATPAPNDNIEIGSHAEFLGVCTQAEMLAMFFINANKEHTFFVEGKAYRKKGSNNGGQEWRLKHHAEKPFFRWLASWAITMTKPSDLGYDDDGFVLPALNIYQHSVSVDYVPEGQLLFTGLAGVGERAAVRRSTTNARLDVLKDLVSDDEQWIIWVGLDAESRAVTEAIPDAVEVKGSDDPEYKAAIFEAFQDGQIRVLVTKPRIGGFGMNFQNAHKMAFFGLNDSWETWYQCIRREWRYGQRQPVQVHVILSDLEGEIYRNILRKDAMATRLRDGLIEQVREYEKGEIGMSEPQRTQYEERTVRGENWTAMLGDSCERLREIGNDTIDLSVYSPPFADLYTYTDSERDLGNSRDAGEFFQHYAFIIREILRVTKPGRLTCVHTSDIPAMAQRDGYIGIKDFPGDVIRAYEAEGWVFVGRAYVQKNPQAQAIRTKSKALLFVQLRKDSSDSRPALIDQVLLFRKPGRNATPIRPVDNGEMDNETWIEWAHGIWLGIHETDTLQYSVARDANDEKHICPLQLGTIERCIKLYSNPGETVLTPFMGIGSEAYQAIRFGRRAIGIELKPSYFDVAVKNLQAAEAQSKMPILFDFAQTAGA